MATLLEKNKITLAENGIIPLPEPIRRLAGLESGDELVVVWSPPNTILLRKISEVAADDQAFAGLMREFDSVLQSAGYETEEDIITLVRAIKAEQIAEWSQEP